jgi:hypothetical protein
MADKTSTTKNTTNIRTASNFQGVDTRSSFSTIDTVAGYRSREDKTLLPPNTMIYPSLGGLRTEKVILCTELLIQP